jgi:hypothetical protein
MIIGSIRWCVWTRGIVAKLFLLNNHETQITPTLFIRHGITAGINLLTSESFSVTFLTLM